MEVKKIVFFHSMSKNVNIRDLLEKADRTLYRKRSNDPECPLFQFLPKEKNLRVQSWKYVFSNRIIFRYDM